ncbi:MAG TPA: DUF2500 family protein, partial [Erysipelotrichaceae bacterium]|nr:DUF2500 family protein [Erysipelotrichaceae bacterium]
MAFPIPNLGISGILFELLFNILFWGVFFFIFSMFAVQIYRSYKEKTINDRAEVSKAYSTVIGKRTYVRNLTTYYVTFESDNDDRREFQVSGDALFDYILISWH